ncbi:MAG: hypothetical protein K2N05_11695 [Muribaculaceae bacterium]|nr:hypothetical protein [Muribaculaceae bacterium]
MKLIKSFIIAFSSLFSVLFPLLCTAQELKVRSMEIQPNDISAHTNPRTDLNGDLCALLKIYVKDKITEVQGNYMGEFVDKGMEKWVYVSDHTKEIGLSFQNHFPIKINFKDFNYTTVSEGMTYIIKLVEENEESPQPTEDTSSINRNNQSSDYYHVTSFTVGSKSVKIPSLTEFKPLLEKMDLGGSRVKSITFMGLTPSIGMGSMADAFGRFTKARTYADASEYGETLSEYEFDSKQKITSLYQDAMIGSEFDYNQAGLPSVITYGEGGYRGSPSYTIRYDITWNGSQASSINSTVLEFESEYIDDYNEAELGPDNLDFASDMAWDNIKRLLAASNSTIKVNGQECKITGTDADGEPITYWCKVDLY